MVTTLIVTLAAGALLGAGITLYSIYTAQEGFEDEEGFHPTKRDAKERSRSGDAENPPRDAALQRSRRGEFLRPTSGAWIDLEPSP